LDEEVATFEKGSPVDVHLGDADPLERFSESRTFRHPPGHDDEGAVHPAAFIEPAGVSRPLQLPTVTPPPALPTPIPSAGAESKTPAPAPAPAGASPPPKPG